MRKKLFSKLTGCLVLPLFVWISIYPSWAEALSNYGDEGRDFGTSALVGAGSGSYDEGAQSLQLNLGGAQSPVSINIMELFPELNIDAERTSIDGLYEDEDAIEAGVGQTLGVLQDEESMTGEAFRTIFSGMQASSRPNLKNDPIWQQTDQVLDQVFSGGMTDCFRTMVTTRKDTMVRSSDRRYCERLLKEPVCEAERVVTSAEYKIGTQCEAGELLATFAGRKSTWRYWCGDDGKSIGIGASLSSPWAWLSLPLAESYHHIPSSIIQFVATCEDNGPHRTCTYSGGSYKRFHPAGPSRVWDWLAHHENSNHTINFWNYEEEGLTTEGFIRHTPPGCNRPDSFCQTDDTTWECLKYDNHRVINGVELTPELVGSTGATCPSGYIKSGGNCYKSPAVSCPSGFNYHGYTQGGYWCVKDGSPETGCSPFDELFYLSTYPEVAAAIAATPPTYESGYAHYLTAGMMDGFLASATSGVWVPDEELYCAMEATAVNCPSGETLESEGENAGSCKRSTDLGNSLEPLFPGDNPGENICWLARAVRNCDYNIGPMDCWTDLYGEEQCEENDGTHVSEVINLDGTTLTQSRLGCAELESDPACVFLRSECVDGAMVDGKCYVWEDTYDCGEDIPISDLDVIETIVCADDYTCPGGKCVTHENPYNDSFNRAVANLQAAQYAMGDMDCEISEEGGMVGSCTIFGGNPFECKIAVGGWQDCCDNPVQQDMQSYMDMLGSSGKLYSSMQSVSMSADEGIDIGAWSVFGEGVGGYLNHGVSNAGSYYRIINGAVTGDWESVTVGVGEMVIKEVVVEYVKDFVKELIVENVLEELQKMLAEIGMEFVGQAIGNMVATAGATTAGSTAAGTQAAASAVGSLVAGVISVVGWIYLVYQIANIVVQLVYKCEEEEFELATKEALGTCSYVGSYCKSKILGSCIERRRSFCCFESPLSRIIMEQAKKQFVGTASAFGHPKSPNCDGLTFEQLGALDWDLIDLGEWVGMLATTGHLPSAGDYELDIEALTGRPNEMNMGAAVDRSATFDGSNYNIEFAERKNVAERTDSKLSGVPLEETNQDLRQELYQIAPNLPKLR